MLKIKNLSKSYSKKESINNVLKNINLNFNKNEFVFILGPSGAGKSTLLNIIAGLDRKYDGKVIVDNLDISKLKNNKMDYYRSTYIGFIFQNYNLINEFTVYENVYLAISLTNKKNKKEKVISTLEKVGLKDKINSYPNELSGGQKQRVAIARALINDPNIILADEPTGALDSFMSTEIMDLIKDISKSKLVIMVSHNEKLASKYANRIINMLDGKIINDTLKNKKENTKEVFKLSKTKMPFKIKLKLSLKSIRKKIKRTILTITALSVGLIGISLVLALSNGFKSELKNYEVNTLSSFPVIINKKIEDYSSNTIKHKKNKIYSYDYNVLNNIHINKIDNNYINYLNKINKDLFRLEFNYFTKFNIMYEENNKYNLLNNTTMKLISNDHNYDVVSGRLPLNINEIVIILDKDNNISKDIIDMFFINKKVLDYNDLLGKEIKLINNNEFYNKSLENTFTINKDMTKMYNNENNYTLKVVGILREKDDDINNLINNFSNIDKQYFGCLNSLIEKYIIINNKSDIVNFIKNANDKVYVENLYYEKDELLSILGCNSNPNSIYIYPKDFNSKNKLIKELNIYNKKRTKENKIMYINYSKEVSDITFNIIKSVTTILIAFSSISLIVSSIMIGIITYISVLEKEREIGILRSLGATKKDITFLFLTELFLIGILSSLLSVLLTKLIVIPLNAILFKLTGLKNIALLNINHFIIIIIISILINLIGGFIPSLLASKKDPIKAINNN